MKNLIFTAICILAVCTSQAQNNDSTYQISGAGRTELLTKRYGNLIRYWVETVRGSGHVVKVASKVSFARVDVMRWRKNAQNKMVSDVQTTNYNPSAFNFQFFLDSPAYKGGLQYDLLLYVNAGDKDYSWRIHLLKK